MNRMIGMGLAMAVGLLSAGAGPAQASNTFLTMDSMPAGTTPGQVFIAFTQLIQKKLPIEIQVSAGKPAPKAAVDAAAGKVDLFMSSPSIMHFMQTQTAMYEKVKNSPEMAKKLRGIFNYSLGAYHIVVYEDSGIRTIEDFRGKRVFLGAPGGAGTKVAMQIVEAASDLVPGEDFELMKFDWKSAETAFLDRQMDVYVIPTSVPSPTIEQFALTGKIRLLGVPGDAWDKPSIQAALSLRGRTRESIPPNSYENQVNEEPVGTIGSWVGLGTNSDVDADVVYEMTKTFWENIADVHATAEWMKSINKETGLKEMNLPLHPGAYRYYKEAGWDIPDEIVPPEAR